MSITPLTPNFNNEDINPCLEEKKLTNKCLEAELYDYNKCTKYFENYRMCKKFWNSISKQRTRAGVSPQMPTKAEREKILELKRQGIKVFRVEKIYCDLCSHILQKTLKHCYCASSLAAQTEEGDQWISFPKNNNSRESIVF